MYRTRGCPFCVMAAEWFADRGIQVEETYLDDHPDRHGLTSSVLPGHTTVPLILIDGTPLGGWEELRAAAARGKLDHLLFPEA